MQAVLVALLLQIATAQPIIMDGTVGDPQGSRVPNATVQVQAGGTVVAETRTGVDGLFTFVLIGQAGPFRLIVTAPGFAQYVEDLSAAAPEPLTITLQPAPFFEAVQVTSTRGDVARADPTVTAAVFPSSELITSAPLTIDDALKMIPGFTLFPSSRVANPTTQTMVLRGLGGSGVNRSLVLADGVPLNDAFGGWVYWGKVPLMAIDRIEVIRGGGSDLYGADAVGGVVQILTLDPVRTMARALLEVGSHDTGRISLFGGARMRGWSVGGAGQWFTTEGYVLVAPDERGAVERPSGSAHRSAFAFATYTSGTGWRAGARAGVFSEDRRNGTPLQVNDTDARQASAEVATPVGAGFLSAHVYGGTQRYDQTFSTISAEPPRAFELLDRSQRVPTRIGGGSLQWTRDWGRSSILLGTEARVTEGHSRETPAVEGVTASTSNAGGSERVGSGYARASVAVTDRFTVVTGAHADVWRAAGDNSSFEHTVGAFNPRMSLAYRLGETGLALRASVLGGFRAPTLNELHRRVQIGNDVTLPNEALRPERLRMAEIGLVASRGRASVRATGFWSVLRDTITAVTLATSPALNIRQRRNADRMRSAGVELEADVRLPHAFSVAMTAVVLDSRFTGRSHLRNYRVPQVARYSVGIGGRYDGRLWTASTQMRVTGPQFDDDVNTRRLRRATVVDAFGGRTLARRVMVFVAVENLFDADYDIGRTPTRTVGLPRAIRSGVQILFP